MRRVHTKSRNGCSACKQRRVKCCEKKPACSRCLKNGLQCSLVFLTPALASARAKMTGLPQFRTPELNPSLAPHSLDLNSLELLHHYTTFACLTFAPEHNMDIWQKAIPQLAMSHQFLMLGMLSVSALHLAYLQPQRRNEFVQRASTCKQLALKYYHRHVSIDDPTMVHSALAFGGFVVPYILAQSAASDASVGRIPSLNDSSPHWFHVIRGLVQLTIKAWPHLIKGPFSPLLLRAEQPFQPEKNPDDFHFLKIRDILDQSISSTAAEERVMDVCRETLEELRRVAGVPYSRCNRHGILTVINVWPGTISSEFMLLLHQRRPEALIILAHYCVLLKKVNCYWYLEGVGAKMLGEIEKILERKWLPCIEWALDQTEIWADTEYVNLNV